MEASLALFPDDRRSDPPEQAPAPASPPHVRIVVYGTPQPAGSKSSFVVGKEGERKRVVTVDANKKSRPWKDMVTQEAGRQMEGRELLRGAIAIRVLFYRARPQGHFGKKGLRPAAPKYPTTKPDLTKYLRGAEDALRGVAWKDDAQVVSQTNHKRYGTPERVEIEIWELAG